MKTISVVINPIAGGGRGQSVWNELQPGLNAIFDRVDYTVSNKVDDLATITRTLLEKSPDYLLVIGGDGTLSHAVNGMIMDEQWIAPETKIAFFNAGCGGDFARQFPAQHITEFLDRLTHNQGIHSNVGKITWSDHSVKYFINIASCGLSGYVVMATEKSKILKKLGGTLNYLIHSITGLMTYNNTPVRIQIDNHNPLDCSMLMMAVGNGQYFGGGMHVAPMAKMDDNMFDVVLFQDFSKIEALFKFHKIYSGKHLLDRNVHYVQARKVSIEPLGPNPIEIEADGEPVGVTPAQFELLNDQLFLII